MKPAKKTRVFFFYDISSILFLLGIFIGFSLAVIGGRKISQKFSYPDIQRFSDHLQRDTQHYPTASAMIQTVIKYSTMDQVAVIIGGNSVLRGFGQPVDRLWSSNLQHKLGNKFKVFNFASPLGSTQYNSALVGEAIHNLGRKVIVIFNSLNNLPSPMFQQWDAYLYLETYYRKTIDRSPERDQLTNSMWNKYPNEFMLKGYFNSFLYFNDLWTFISFEYFTTFYTSIIGRRSFEPRKNFSETTWPFDNRSAEELFKDRSIYPRERVKLELPPITKVDKNGKVVANENWPAYRNQNKATAISMIPLKIRKRSIVAILLPNPFFVQSLGIDDKTNYQLGGLEIAKMWSEAGYQTVVSGPEIPGNEWNDGFHLAGPGGFRLADRIAPEIIRLSQKLYGPNTAQGASP